MNLKMCLVSAILVFFCSCRENVTVDKSVLKVKCEQLGSSSQCDVVSTYPGKISPMKDVNLSFRVAGIVEKILVKEGQFVKEGEIVAKMDDRDYKLQLAATSAEYDAIKGEVDRVVALYKENSVTPNDYEKAVNGLKQITSKLSAHRNALSDTNLKAPFDGYIQKINFNKGEALSAGMPVMTFISSSAPEVIVNIPQVEYLRRDQLSSATATINGYDSTIFTLKKISISHKSNLNQLYQARFRVDTKDGISPSLGASAMVSLNYGVDETEQFTLPFSSIVEQNGDSFVWRVKDGKVSLCSVKIEKIKGDGTAIISGEIYKGDIIVTAGVRSLNDGMSVEPLPQAPASNVGELL